MISPSILLSLLWFTSTIRLICCAAVTAYQPLTHDTAILPKGSKPTSLQCSEKAAKISFSSFRAQNFENCDSSAYLAVEFATENGTLMVDSTPIFPASLPMQLKAVEYGCTGQETTTLAYELNSRSVSSGPDGLLGYEFELRIKLVDLHGQPVTDFLMILMLRKSFDGNLILSHAGTDRIADSRRDWVSWVSYIHRGGRTVSTTADIVPCIHEKPPPLKPEYNNNTPSAVGAHRPIAGSNNGHQGR